MEAFFILWGYECFIVRHEKHRMPYEFLLRIAQKYKEEWPLFLGRRSIEDEWSTPKF
jgi:hypothetical protein